LDGDQHGPPKKRTYDEARTAELNKLGLLVLRFTNEEIDKSLDAACACINQAVRDRLPPDRAASFQPPETEFE
jgi:very-short-patch-repair endonuclease